MADPGAGARLLIPPGEDRGRGERWDRLPALVAAAFVVIPAAMVPALGFGAVARSGDGVLRTVLAGTLAGIGALGLATIVAGALAAIRAVHAPVPALLVAGGTTIALAAGVLLVPVLMAGLAAA